MSVTRLGFLRSIFSATCNMYLRPPAASSIEAQVTTARMISMTVTGGEVGGILKTKTSTTKPIPETTPKPMPPYREPMHNISKRNRNSKYNIGISSIKCSGFILSRYQSKRVNAAHRTLLFKTGIPFLSDNSRKSRFL